MSRTAKPENMTAFGKIVCERLKEMNMSQKELASRLYVNKVYLNRLLYGEYVAQMRMIIAMSKELGIDAVKLAEAALNGKEGE